MFKIWILILCLGSCGSTNKCVIEKSEFIDAIELLYSKDILSINKESINIKISDDMQSIFDFDMGKEIIIKSKKIRLKNSGERGNHWLHIHKFALSAIKENRKLVFFTAGDGAYQYSGEISFDCHDGKYKVVDVHFVSSIN